METRTIQQVKVYLLILNPMDGKAEAEQVAAISFSKERLERLLIEEESHWEDEKIIFGEENSKWRKTFKKGSLLEWFNKMRWNSHRPFIEEDWINQSEQQKIETDPRFVR